MGEVSYFLPITNAIHNINHTQTKRVCMLHDNHKQSPVLVSTLNVTDSVHDFYNLIPGLYAVIINGIKYYFDLYVTINDISPLTIKSPNNAYVFVGGKRYIMNLYKEIDSQIDTNDFVFNNTVNNHIEVMVIDGRTVQIPYYPNDVQDRYAVIPYNGIIPSSAQQAIESMTLEQLQQHNRILYNLDYEKFGENNGLVSLGGGIEFNPGDKNIDNPYDIRSISKFNIISSNTPTSNTSNNYNTEILLQNNIKSLPNGIKDTLILNTEQYQAHIAYRIGRSFLTGGENYIFISDKSDNNSWLFWMANKNIRISSDIGSIVCSHLKSKTPDSVINGEIGISVSTREYGNGAFIRIPSMEVHGEHIIESIIFKQWLQNQIDIKIPVVIEYQLSSYKYKTVLLDRYRAKTFYNKTYVRLDDNYKVSYFYKTLK